MSSVSPLFLPNLGFSELLLILVIVLIFFGVGKLPEVLKTMGEGVKAFRDASTGAEDTKKGRSKEIDVTPEATAERVKEAEEVHR